MKIMQQNELIKAKSHEWIIKNNILVKKNEAFIDINERGFLFGDGFFETCRINNGKILNFINHIERIKKTIMFLNFAINLKEIIKSCEILINKNNIINGIIKIHISRGLGSIGYLPKENIENLIIIQTLDLPSEIEDVSLILTEHKSANYNFKSLNSLPYVMAKIYANEHKYYDTLMLDNYANISETASANIYWIKDKIIYTPSDECSLIHGTIRSLLLTFKNLEIKTGKYSIETILDADEVFITNAIIIIKSVNKIAFGDKKNFYIKNYNKKLVNSIEKQLKIEMNFI